MRGLEAEELWERTERLRQELYDIVDKNGITSPEAIRASQELDEKVNEYYRLKRKGR
jgi:hypothetical protein